MSYFKFYVEKLQFMLALARSREWKLFREEWSITYAEMQDAHSRFKEIEKEAIERLLRVLEQE